MQTTTHARRAGTRASRGSHYSEQRHDSDAPPDVMWQASRDFEWQSFGADADCVDHGRARGVGAGVAVNLIEAFRVEPTPSLRSLTARNALLASLSDDAVRRLRPTIERVHVTRGQLLATPGVRMPYAYFPLRGVVALVAMTSDGESVQVAMVGPEGIVGLPTVLHEDVMPYQAVAPVTLDAVRVRLSSLLTEVRGNSAFQARLLGYAHHQVTAMTRAAVCHRFHTTLQRLCLWLLTASDGLHAETVDVTQELLAQLLGTTRTGVSVAASILDDGGVIRQRRARVRILQRAGLCARVCDCYDLPMERPLRRVR